MQGLGDVRHGPVRQALLAQRRLIVCRDHDDRYPYMRLRELALHVAAGEAGHLIVENRAVGKARAQCIEELLPRGEHIDIVLRCVQHPRERTPHGFLVIHYRNQGTCRHHDTTLGDRGARCGSGPSSYAPTLAVKWNMAPPSPGAFSAHSRPPCASMMERQIASPSPSPCFLVVTKGWKMRSRSAALMP